MKMEKRIPLGIVMTYPVRWGTYEVLRDFVQNFYDSVEISVWAQSFHYDFVDGVLSMWVDGVTFSYEWLLHIGASTKTASNSHAGFYGEGFKIASLCAYRDLGWSVEMSSGDWELEVTSIDETIDGRNIKMLAYDMGKGSGANCSRLTLKTLPESDFARFRSILSSFYYPENPLFGRKLWEGEIGAVYLRSDAPYDTGLPCTHEFGRKGAVFCGYQLLGSSPFGLVVCLHRWRKQDRERKALYTFDVVDVFDTVSHFVSSSCAATMLEKMRRYWNSYPTKHIDIHSWHQVICNLVASLARSPLESQRFVERFPNLLCQRPPRTMRERNRRTQARAWLSTQPASYRVVQSAFERLGYASLEEKCEECGGFVLDDSPTSCEAACFEVLEGLVKALYSGFFVQDEVPERKVIRNAGASCHGMATLHKELKGTKNPMGIKVRYKVGEIYLKETIFHKAGYYDAVATYVHESCHAFGGDSSESFSGALTLAMEILLRASGVVDEYQRRWGEVFADIDTLL